MRPAMAMSSLRSHLKKPCEQTLTAIFAAKALFAERSPISNTACALDENPKAQPAAAVPLIALLGMSETFTSPGRASILAAFVSASPPDDEFAECNGVVPPLCGQTVGKLAQTAGIVQIRRKGTPAIAALIEEIVYSPLWIMPATMAASAWPSL